ncbi:MAG: dUTP diphosphatase [Tissierellia bacterium]|nr:dUTP diphosphatase [Tissierellia bacterium]
MNNEKVLKIVSEGTLPQYATEGSAGFDLFCNNESPIIANPNEVVKVPTGLKMEIPKGYFGAIYPRSSAGIKSRIKLANTTGIIDSDYRGEVVLFLVNEGDTPLEISKGDRLAQMVIQPYIQVKIVQVDTLEETQRGEGGIGHTGLKEIKYSK